MRRAAWAAAPLFLLFGCSSGEPAAGAPTNTLPSAIPVAAVGAVGADFDARVLPAPDPDEALREEVRAPASPFGSPTADDDEAEPEEPPSEPLEPSGVNL